MYIFFSAVNQSMLKDDELFKEASDSPNPSVTDDDFTAWETATDTRLGPAVK